MWPSRYDSGRRALEKDIKGRLIAAKLFFVESELEARQAVGIVVAVTPTEAVRVEVDSSSDSGVSGERSVAMAKTTSRVVTVTEEADCIEILESETSEKKRRPRTIMYYLRNLVAFCQNQGIKRESVLALSKADLGKLVNTATKGVELDIVTKVRVMQDLPEFWVSERKQETLSIEEDFSARFPSTLASENSGTDSVS